MNSTAKLTGPVLVFDETVNVIDIVWLVTCSTLVFFMQTGFAMLEVGIVSFTSAKSILMKNFGDVCFGAIAFYAVGFGVAFGDGNGFIGKTFHFLIDYPSEDYAFFAFQFSFAATAATIVSGAVCERIKIIGYLFFSLLMTSWIYPVVVHWVWSDTGFLSKSNPNAFLGGMIDFAGSAVVHMVGGAAGLLGCKLLGFRNQYTADKVARQPRFEKRDGKWRENFLPPNSEALAALGVFILWFGWFGFNAGSVINVYGSSFLIGRVMICTILAPSAAMSSSLFTGYLIHRGRKRFNLADSLNGILGGLVVITAGCAVFQPWAAVVVGIIGGVFEALVDRLLPKLRIDDPIGAIPVHLASGFVGTVLVGFFADPEFVADVYGADSDYGVFYGGSGELLAANFLGSIIILLWSGSWSFCAFYFMTYLDRDRPDTWFIYRGESVEVLEFGAEEAAPPNPLSRFGMGKPGGEGVQFRELDQSDFAPPEGVMKLGTSESFSSESLEDGMEDNDYISYHDESDSGSSSSASSIGSKDFADSDRASDEVDTRTDIDRDAGIREENVDSLSGNSSPHVEENVSAALVPISAPKERSMGMKKRKGKKKKSQKTAVRIEETELESV